MSDSEKTIAFHPHVQNTACDTEEKTLLFAEALVCEDPPRASKDKQHHAQRYGFIEHLGVGAMGKVVRVFDQKFQRYVAQKTLLHQHQDRAFLRILFQNEAQITGALQHSGIVPIYDFEANEETISFTMREVNGITLQEAIEKAHDEQDASWHIHDLLSVFGRICETMAFAHQQGVVHRDIKPDNIMIGEHGEVWVMDWGFAKVTKGSPLLQQISGLYTSRKGIVVGTPIYLPPEQAQGDSDLVDVHSDVFSLGAMLYYIMTGEKPRKGNLEDTLQHAMNGDDLPDLPKVFESNMVLQDIYKTSTQIDIRKRYASAVPLSKAVHNWIVGNEKQKQSEALVQEADEMLQKWNRLQAEIVELTKKVKESAKLPLWTPVSEKALLWSLEDTLLERTQDLDMTELYLVEKLRTALNFTPDSRVAHQKLADLYHAKLELLEGEEDTRKRKVLETLLWIHDRGTYQSYFSAQKQILFDIPAGCSVSLSVLKEEERRIRPFFYSQDVMPQMTLELGSYLLQVNKEIRVPFVIERKGDEQQRISLDIPEYIPQGACFVHAGAYLSGTRPFQTKSLSSFCMQQFPITNREYLFFLNDLARNGAVEQALDCTPYHRGAAGVKVAERLRVYGFDESREEPFFLQPDSDGDMWELDWPVILISIPQAQQYAQWYSQRTGVFWELPTTNQWEKAARGVDGRLFPWGNRLEATWSCLRGSKKGALLPSVIHEFPEDCSVYEIRGLMGNVQDMCICSDTNTEFFAMGGAWSYHSNALTILVKRSIRKDDNSEVCGFRLVHNY